jgi:vanillate O-demethylase monooxygenase subunit
MVSLSNHDKLRARGSEMFLRNAWYCAAIAREIGPQPVGHIFLNEPVVLFRTPDGTAHALEDRCCHRRAPLSKGKLEGDKLRCGYHGFLYDTAGKVVWVPGQDRVPPEAQVRAYPICEKHGWTWIWMGDPALADPATAPAFHWFDAPGWAACGDRMPVAANYFLLIDNLLDLSHLAFLHAATIGATDDTAPDLVWERGADFVRGVRVARNISPSPRQLALGQPWKTDSTKIMTYTAPANVVIDIRAVESGKTADDPTNRVNRHIVVLDSMTPETETTCHYFWGSCRNFRTDDPKFTEEDYRTTVVAFTEDTEMLMAEQRIIDLDPAAPQVDVTGDQGGLQARRLFAKLLADEQGLRAAAE